MTGCQSNKSQIDSIFFNAKIYTVDSSFSIAESFAVNKGIIVGVGTYENLSSIYQADSVIDLNGKFVFPGLIDAHCHFVGYAQNLSVADLTGTKSFDEVLTRLKEFSVNHKNEWITGRGWDQNDWEDKTFPSNKELNEIFPDRPVVIVRIDGHAALVNSEVLKRAKINSGTRIDGGEVVCKNGLPTGILVDNAMTLYEKLIPVNSDDDLKVMLEKAQQNCFAVGLTSVGDAGLDLKTINFIDSLQKSGILKMRINAMLNSDGESLDFIRNGKNIKTDYLRVASLKLYADGALGSRGACLLDPYNDQPDYFGLTTISSDSMKSICNLAFENNYQICVHAIGDSANRMVLKVFSSVLQSKNDSRWRIEHCQVIHKDDFSMFGNFSIIPSVQPTHATSDMYWAEARLGKERIKTAYAYQQLLEQNGWLACGSDFPIESINPLLGFYAAIARKDKTGFPESGFQPENALTPEQALKGMTIWAAKAAFEENEKGSIEPGKFADFVVMNKNILEINPTEILNTKILKTYIGGKEVYSDK